MSKMKRSSDRLVYVTLPGATVETVKDLPDSFSVLLIKEHLELLASLPSFVYRLKKSDGSFLNDKDTIQYGVSLRHSTVLKIDLLPAYMSLYWKIKNNQHVEVMSTVSKQSSNEEKCSLPFFAMYLAAGIGQVTLCKKLFNVGLVTPSDTTPFGRSPLHAAAAHDSLSVTQFLIQNGWRVKVQDQQGCSVLNVASRFGAASCERWMRLWCLSKEGWVKEHEKNPGKLKSNQKEADSRLNPNDLVGANMKDVSKGNTVSSYFMENDQPLDLKSSQAVIIPRRESVDKHLNNVRKIKTSKRRFPPATNNNWAVLQWITSPRNMQHQPEHKWSSRPFSAGNNNRITRSVPYLELSKVENSTVSTPRQNFKLKEKVRHVEIDLSYHDNKRDEEKQVEKKGQIESNQMKSSLEKNNDSILAENAPASTFSRRSSLKYSDRQMTIFRLGDTDPTPLPATDPGEYSKSYRKWKEERHNMAFGTDEPQTYEEWLEHKEFISGKRSNRRKSEVAESILTNRNQINCTLLNGFTSRQKSARRVTWKQ